MKSAGSANKKNPPMVKAIVAVAIAMIGAAIIGLIQGDNHITIGGVIGMTAVLGTIVAMIIAIAKRT